MKRIIYSIFAENKIRRKYLDSYPDLNVAKSMAKKYVIFYPNNRIVIIKEKEKKRL